MTAAPPTPTDLKSALEEMRARAAGEGTDKGPAARAGLAARAGVQGAIEKAFLAFLNLLLKMVEDFRAGRMAPIAPVAEEATGDARTDRAVAYPPPKLVRSAAQPPAKGEGEEARWFGCWADPAWRAADGVAGADCEGEDAPSPISRVAERVSDRSAVEACPPSAPDTRAAPCMRARKPAARSLCAARRPPRLAMMSGLRRCAEWRNTRGRRRAFPPYGDVADGIQRKFLKMRIWAKGSARRCCSTINTTM
jgi:hypothetical protein